MRLKRLELQGFKSFLDRTILTFESGVTGVVGPNGCGKSNIVDAIMWVMGEQSPKHLRGDSMTDIIFNGSDSRAPTSMAEVSLVMDRQGVALAPQFAAFDKSEEISVTRRIYRDGTGEFLINKTQCRLRDIHELFMDTGVGRRAYSIIEQGQIDRMINVKPEERRYLFEEVAGITKYKAKRKEAERKLELTRLNILRLQDIITELEKQIRSLKIQATRARKYKELKGELEVVDLYLLGRNLHAHRKAVEALETQRNELVSNRSESDALFAQVDAEVTELEVVRIDQERDFQELGNAERDLALAIQKLESSLSLLDERRKYLSQAGQALETEVEELRQKEASLDDDSQTQEQERVELQQSLVALDEEVSEKDQSLRSAQENKQLLTQKRSQSQQRLNQFSQKEVQLQNQLEYGEQKEREIQSARGQINIKLTETAEALESHRANLKEAEEKITACAERASSAETEVAALHSECEAISRRLSELEEALFATRETYHTKNSRLQSLTELQENLEGYSPTAKEILLKIQGSGGEARPLAEILQPELALEEHLELLLGADMNTLLVKTSEEAERLAEMISSQGLERVKVAALTGLQSSTKNFDGITATPLLSKIRVTEGYEAAAQRWLGDAFLCSSETEVFESRKAFPGATFLCLGSNVIAHSDGTLSTGTVQTHMGVFQRRREIEELSVVTKELDGKLHELTLENQTTLAHLETQEKRHSEVKDKLSSIHIESVECRKEKEKIQSELGRADRDYVGLTQDAERNLAQLTTLAEQIDQWKRELATVEAERENFASEIVGLETEIVQAQEQFDALLVAINDRKIERSKLGERLNGIQYKLEKIASEIASLEHRRQIIHNQRAQDEKELIRIDAESAEVKAKQEASNQDRNQTLVKISDVKAAFNETCQKLQSLREQKDELQDKRESVLEQIQELELKAAQAKSQLEQVLGISLERYHREPTALSEETPLDLTQTPLFTSQLEVTWELLLAHEKEALLQEHITNVRTKVDRYGEVNLTAIQEFDEIQKRFDFLTHQQNDLENSIKILEEAILKIDESTKQRFEDTFDAVNRKFKEIFPILFNGGKAELALTDPMNLLESGVDVMVQPPGKRLQSITLLSGGEKALTAVSLILAIFARKPSPFCLLDEVDAPLDDANVSRFNTVIRKMAEKTQFIVITHNKKTMEIAEALYGVTMERAGVSKMTSVRMN
jgi:chromosome segregation protein